MRISCKSIASSKQSFSNVNRCRTATVQHTSLKIKSANTLRCKSNRPLEPLSIHLFHKTNASSSKLTSTKLVREAHRYFASSSSSSKETQPSTKDTPSKSKSTPKMPDFAKVAAKLKAENPIENEEEEITEALIQKLIEDGSLQLDDLLPEHEGVEEEEEEEEEKDVKIDNVVPGGSKQSAQVPFNFDRKAAVEIRKGGRAAAKGQHEKAIQHLTKAIELDPDSTPAMISRAGIYYILGRYDECVVDCRACISMELKTEIPTQSIIAEAYSKIGLIHFHKEEFLKARDAFKASLEAEESAEAKRLLERTENILGDVSRVWFDPKVDDEYYRELVKDTDVEIRLSPVHGRGVFVTEDIEEGDIVFVETAIAAMPSFTNEAFKQKFGKDAERMILKMRSDFGVTPVQKVECEQCDKPFCTPNCKEDAVNGHHSIECYFSHGEAYGFFSTFCKRMGGETSMFMARILASYYRDPSIGEHLSRMCYVPSNNPDLPHNELQQLHLMTYLFPKEFRNSLTVETVRNLRSVINLNSQSLVTQSVGVHVTMKDKENITLDEEYHDRVEVAALFPIASYINHSCEPNVIIGNVLDGTYDVPFIATRDIKKGEELFMCYFYDEDTKKRREELYNKYYFWCECPTCQSELK